MLDNILNNAIQILKMLEDNGYEAYMVGGFPRDYVLGIKSDDIDITTNAIPSEVQRIFPNNFFKSIKYQTVTVVMNSYTYEVTTYRTESDYKDHRHPYTKVSTSLKSDIKRRDFTINALCMDKELNIIDYTNGLNDIKNKVIKTVGSPDVRFFEDALRMFRAFRFVSKLNFKIDSDTYQAIKKNAHLVKYISKERVKEELIKMLNAPYFEDALPQLIESKILSEYKEIEHALSYLYARYRKVDLILLLSLATFFKGSICEELILSKRERKLLEKIFEYTKLLTSRSFSRESLLDLDIEAFDYSFELMNLLDNLTYNKDDVLDLYYSLPIKSIRDLAVNGMDIKKVFKIKDSPQIGEMLKRALTLVIHSRIDNNAHEIIEELKKEYNG